MPRPVGASEWSQRSSRPDAEPIFINSGDPRIAEAVRRKFIDIQEREDRFDARAYLRALRKRRDLTDEQWAAAWECSIRLLDYGANHRNAFPAVNLSLILKRQFLDAVEAMVATLIHEEYFALREAAFEAANDPTCGDDAK